MVQTAVEQAQLYINGEWVSASSGASFDVYNPATGELWARWPTAPRRAPAPSTRPPALPAWRALTAERAPKC